jgi:hypothetical protein
MPSRQGSQSGNHNRPHNPRVDGFASRDQHNIQHTLFANWLRQPIPASAKAALCTRTVLAVVVATLCIQRSTRLHPASRRCWPRYSTTLLALKVSIAESRLVFSRCQAASSNPLWMITMLLFLGTCQLREAWPLRLIRTIPVSSLSHLPREVTHTQAAVIRVQRDVGKSSRVARTFLSEAIEKIRLWRA